MELISNSENVVQSIDYKFPLAHSCQAFAGVHNHKDLARIIFEHNFATRMIVVIEESLASEHWDDPVYLHKTNNIGICELEEEARKDLTNRYFSQQELDDIFARHRFPDWEFNYKESARRSFKHTLEDKLFEYQTLRKMLEILPDAVDSANYVWDEDGYPKEDEDGECTLQTDPVIVEKQKEAMLESLLLPRVFTRHERVYDMPTPLNHWDSRSRWHQFFFVEIPLEGITFNARGNGGSSGAREANGCWAHTFATLSRSYGTETPTSVLTYDKHNKLYIKEHYANFMTLHFDLSGNYPGDRKEMSMLFEDRILPISEHVYKSAWCDND